MGEAFLDTHMHAHILAEIKGKKSMTCYTMREKGDHEQHSVVRVIILLGVNRTKISLCHNHHGHLRG